MALVDTRAKYRTIAEEKIGRSLTFSEHVHHINGDTTDNSPDNLLVISPREHALIHKEMRRREKIGEDRQKAKEPKTYEPTMGPWWGPDQAAEILALDRVQLREQLDAGLFPGAYRLPSKNGKGEWRISQHAIDSFITRRTP